MTAIVFLVILEKIYFFSSFSKNRKIPAEHPHELGYSRRGLRSSFVAPLNCGVNAGRNNGGLLGDFTIRKMLTDNHRKS